jgi:hypothetical protein
MRFARGVSIAAETKGPATLAELLVTFALLLVLSLAAVEASLVVAVAKAAAQSEERAAATTSLRSATASALQTRSLIRAHLGLTC